MLRRSRGRQVKFKHFAGDFCPNMLRRTQVDETDRARSGFVELTIERALVRVRRATKRREQRQKFRSAETFPA